MVDIVTMRLVCEQEAPEYVVIEGKVYLQTVDAPRTTNDVT